MGFLLPPVPCPYHHHANALDPPISPAKIPWTEIFKYQIGWSAAASLLIFRIVERLQPVASWILDQLIPRSSLGLVGQGSLTAAEFGWIVVGVVAPTRRGDVGVVA